MATSILAALLAAAVLLTLGEAAASAHSAGPPEDVEARIIGREHAREHARIWRAITRERRRWRRLSPAQRRDERRRWARQRERAAAAHHDIPAEPASSVGRWGAPFTVTTDYRGYGIHAALLHSGKVLFWGYPIHRDSAGYASKGNVTYAWLWDPAEGEGLSAVEDVTPVDPDTGEIPSIYCSGMSFLADGRLLIVGGNLTWPDDTPGYTEFAGLNTALIFDPDTEEWTELERPPGSRGRWYPSQVLLGDGRTFVISGLSEEAPGGVLNQDLELYEPPTGGDPLGSFRLFDSNTQRRVTELYPHLFAMPDGKVLMTGPDKPDNALLDPAALESSAANPWTELDRQSVERVGGNAVLEPEGSAGSSRVLQIAGQPTGQAPYATTERLDIDDPTPAWTPGPTLNFGRAYPNTVLLPDRTLATIGGGLTPYSSNGRRMELLAPGASSWALGPKQHEDRAYHSTALLLPDGRVMSGGDDLSPTTDGTRQGSSPDDTIELYSPPYLFKGGTRPAITSGPAQLAWNEPFSVGFTADSQRTVSTAVLVAPGASTHGVDMNQRLVPLDVTQAGANSLALEAPPTPNVAPPGRYMLFVLDSAGVPSIARWVELGPRAAIQVDGEREPDSTLTLRSAQPLFTGPGTRAEQWDLDDDGSYDDLTGPTGTISFARPGSYPVRLRVTTGFLTSETDYTVVIPNNPPVAAFDVSPEAPLAGDPITLTSTSSDAESGITTSWDLDGDGVYPDAVGPSASVTFGSAGSYTVRLRVRDADGGETVATRTIVVGSRPAPPVTDPDPPEDPEPEPEPEPEPDPDPDPDPVTDPQPDPGPGQEPQPEGGETPIIEPDGPDLTAPTLQLGFAERAWLGRLRRNGVLRVRVRVDEPAKVELTLRRNGRRIGRVRVTLPAGTTRTVSLRPRRDALRWLRRARAPRLRFSAVAVDDARNDTAWTRVLRPSDRRRP